MVFPAVFDGLLNKLRERDSGGGGGSGYVPYNGANADLNLGDNNFTIGNRDFFKTDQANKQIQIGIDNVYTGNGNIPLNISANVDAPYAINMENSSDEATAYVAYSLTNYNGNPSGMVLFGSSYLQRGVNDITDSLLIKSAGDGGLSFDAGSGPMRFFVGGAQRMYGSAGGGRIIGSTDLPQVYNTGLEIVGDYNPFIVRGNLSNAYTNIRIYNDQNSSGRALEFGYGGSTYPSALLTGGVVGESAYFATTGAYAMQFGTNNAYRLGIMSDGKMGLWNNAPTVAFEMGTNTAGASQIINPTIGTELAPALTGANGVNWTRSDTTGYSLPLAGTVAKTGDGTGYFRNNNSAFLANRTYKVTIVVQSISGSGFYIRLCGTYPTGVSSTGARSITTAGTYTFYLTTQSIDYLYIIPLATALRMVISGISTKLVENTTGNLTLNDLYINGSVKGSDGINSFQILKDGTVNFGTASVNTNPYKAQINVMTGAMLTEINSTGNGAYGIRTSGAVKGSDWYMYGATGGIYTYAGVALFYTTASNLFGMGGTGTVSKLDIIQPTAGVGTVSNSAGGTTVTGVGTAFTDTFKIGDTITITTGTSETQTITAIASNTSMTTTAWTNAHAGGSAYTLVGGTIFSAKGNGKIGVNNTAPHTSAILDIVSTKHGVVFPRMTNDQMNAIATPTEGLMVYNLTDHKYYAYDGTTRQRFR